MGFANAGPANPARVADPAAGHTTGLSPAGSRWRGVVAVVAAVVMTLVVLPTSAGANGSDPGGERWQVGVGQRKITPTDAELNPPPPAAGLYLGGFGIGVQASRRAVGSDEDTFAQAVVIGDSRQRIAIITLDVVGMGNVWMRNIRNAVAQATGISPRAVLVHISHSHASVDLQGVWGGVIPAYRQRMVTESVAAATDAMADLGPADLRVASVEVPELHANRRGLDEQKDFRDDVMSVLQFTRPNGDVVTTMVNYGAHPTIVGSENNRIGTDFVGPTRDRLASEAGGMGVFINGSLGDLSPRPPSEGTALERAASMGTAVADRALSALQESELVPVGMAVSSVSVTFEANPADGSLLAQLPTLPPAALRALGIDLAAYYEFVVRNGQARVTSMVTTVRLGTPGDYVALATLPGEALSNLGLDLRALLGGNAQFLMATTSDSLGYLIPPAEWRESDFPDPPGRYEETISLERQAGTKVVAAIGTAWNSLSTIPLANFTDIPPGVSFDKGVDWLVDADITQGFGGEGLYSPSVQVNRGQMALFLWRMMGEPAPDAGTECGFEDMGSAPGDMPLAACWLKQQEVTTGVRPGEYDRLGTVTRAQMARFLWRLAGEPAAPLSCGFADVRGDDGLRQATCWLKESGITTGTNPQGTLYSQGANVTRGQMAAFLFRMASNPDAWDAELPPTAPNHPIS